MSGDFSDSNELCLECGLCCNGVIFADVQLEEGDDAEKLRSLGLALATRNAKSETRKFPQPCAAFVNGKCGIYAERPKYCRKFECALLKNVKIGRLDVVTARRIIRETLRQVQKVRQLLHDLGDNDQSLPLSKCFRRVNRELEKSVSDNETAHLFGKLTLAVHELNVRLSGTFYPGEGDHTQKE